MTGKFIVFEGIEGSGKTTQIRSLQRHLVEAGHDVVVTREPGGSELGAEIREILLRVKQKERIDPVAELFLYQADRAQHSIKIWEWLEQGKIVLCDRFIASTVAYQVGGRGMTRKLIESTNAMAIALVLDVITPYLCIWLDLPVDLAQKRIAGREKDRIELEGFEFQERVRYEYQAIASTYGLTRVDASRDQEAVFADVVRLVEGAIAH